MSDAMTSERRKPAHLIEWDGISGMSNFDPGIDEGFEEYLRSGPHWGRHAGWNFNGSVWFEDEQFHEEVWVYGAYRRTFSAPTLRELMNVVNDEYGYE